jgi:hydrogenase maturation protein HypF
VNLKRFQYRFFGIVQGVGFRPFVYHLAVRNNLTGFVQNRSNNVTVEVEGAPPALDIFLDELLRELPPLANITGYERNELPVRHEMNFQILPSDPRGRVDVHITPDAATCPDCLKELFDPYNRRYRYPFINCTNCGPRLTIIKNIPYDRSATSMACFDLCPLCRAEYENPADRRFHAEPNACPMCGPRLSLLDRSGKSVESGDPVQTAVDLLLAGRIIAIKGLGGFHLAVDAANDDAIRTLRIRKFREEKPLAVMARDIHAVKMIANVNTSEEAMLQSPHRPILLLKKISRPPVSDLIAPNVPNLGVMLPYTPLHYLLLEERILALVMTSANQVDEPICISNREALKRLKEIADYFLVHNRDILVRCDDSIAFSASGKIRILRRSRGFAPQPLPLKIDSPPVLALGGELKTTQCLLKDRFAFLSPHIGDMETPQAQDFFSESIRLLSRLTETEPQIIACDLHPAYHSSRVAREMPSENVIRVQHHHAHIASCMAEHQLEGHVLGLAMDGTGYGPDGTAWGGEFLIASETEYRRFGHFQHLILPGGEKAIREPWRIAISLLKNAYGTSWYETAFLLNLCSDRKQMNVLDKMIDGRIHSLHSSSLGRLFDGVAALLGLSRSVSFEGQAAMELESLAAGASAPPYPFNILPTDSDVYRVDTTPMIRAVVTDLMSKRDKAEIAVAFHLTIIEIFSAMVKVMYDATGLRRVVLSGGCFQNRLLLEGSIEKIETDGFEVYSHSLVPTNDGGISLGQAVVAAAIIKKGLQHEK